MRGDGCGGGVYPNDARSTCRSTSGSGDRAKSGAPRRWAGHIEPLHGGELVEDLAHGEARRARSSAPGSQALQAELLQANVDADVGGVGGNRAIGRKPGEAELPGRPRLEGLKAMPPVRPPAARLERKAPAEWAPPAAARAAPPAPA